MRIRGALSTDDIAVVVVVVVAVVALDNYNFKLTDIFTNQMNRILLRR